MPEWDHQKACESYGPALAPAIPQPRQPNLLERTQELEYKVGELQKAMESAFQRINTLEQVLGINQ